MAFLGGIKARTQAKQDHREEILLLLDLYKVGTYDRCK